MLSPTQISQREGKLTASRVSCLMTGDADKIMNLWREMVGDPAFVPEDLSGVWSVQRGVATEHLNLDWFERKHGPISRRGDVVVGSPDWMAATLDGWSEKYRCPVEGKDVGGREPLDTIIDRYQPQMHWLGMVTASEQCALSVIIGGNEPIVELVPLDPDYSAELMSRARLFMHCVETLTPPIAQAPVAAPIVPKVEYDMSTSNEWGAYAGDWLQNVEGKKIAEKAEKALKALVPADGVRCHGHGVVISRARNGNLSLRKDREDRATILKRTGALI